MIGEHTVTLIPDPDAQAWGPVLASNPFLTASLAGWTGLPFQTPWVWQANGTATLPPAGTGGVGFVRDPAYPVPRDAATQYRTRARFSVSRAGWVVCGVYYGTTPAAAAFGPFWEGTNSVEQSAWTYCPTAGSYTVEFVANPGSVPGAFGYVGPFLQFVNDGNAQGAVMDSLEFNGQGAEQVDLTCLVDQVAIHYGRDDADSQPEAATCTLDMSMDTGDVQIPGGLEVGSIIRVTTQTDITNSTRFVGRITDLSMGWEDAGADTPNALVAQVVCASALSELGRRVVGDVPWPQELDGARVGRILSAAGVTVDPTFSDPGTVQIIARDVDAQAALPLAQEAADSANGIVWETRSGEVRYADAMHRRGATPALSLDACDILVTPTWRRNTEGLINAVSIGYGVAPDGGEQPRYTASNPTSQERFGRYELSTATQLATLADATALGQMLLVRNAEPVWIMAALPVDVKGLSPEETAALLGMDMHALINLTGLPAANSAPTSAALWVEGATETLAAGVHELELLVTGYCRTAPAPQWDDVDPGLTWDGAGPPATVTTNAVRSPSGEVSSPLGWAFSNATGTSDAAWSKVGTRSVKLSVTAAGATTYTYPQGSSTAPANKVPCLPGDNVSAHLSAYGLKACAARLSVAFYDAANATVGSINHGAWQAIPLGGVTEFERLNVVVPNDPNIVAWMAILYVAESVSITTPQGTGPYLHVDAAIYVDSGATPLATMPAYFDGDTPDTTTDVYAWTGTPGQSASTHTQQDAGGLTWDDWTCVGPQPNRGRWADVPASLRWNRVDPAITWNTWPSN